MKKTIISIIIYTISFAIFSSIIDTIFYKEISINTIMTKKYLIELIIKSILFGVFMTFFMSRRQKKTNSSEQTQ